MFIKYTNPKLYSISTDFVIMIYNALILLRTKKTNRLFSSIFSPSIKAC